jgi:hypothetical protein
MDSNIPVTVRYNDGTGDVQVPAQRWIRNAVTKKTPGKRRRRKTSPVGSTRLWTPSFPSGRNA